MKTLLQTNIGIKNRLEDQINKMVSKHTTSSAFTALCPEIYPLQNVVMSPSPSSKERKSQYLSTSLKALS